MSALKKPSEFVISATKAGAEYRKALRKDNEQRTQSKTLLNPMDVAGEYDIGRMLMTTLGGVLRPLTQDDLRTFQQHIRSAGDKYKKGINAKTVIDHSLKSDRERANEQIKTAIPVSIAGNVVTFMTNASSKSDRKRHYVKVDFRSLDAAVSCAESPEKAAALVIKSALGIGCDCGRWRYWLAYLANISGYNAGHVEPSFPKIRNPGLVGVACKHVLRVMTVVSQSPNIKNYLANVIRQRRESVLQTDAKNTVAAMKDIAEKMAKESYRQRTIKTTEEKRAQRAAQPAQQRKAAERAAKAAEAVKKAVAKKIQAKAKTLTNAEKKRVISSYTTLLDLKQITQKQFDKKMKELG